MTYNRDREIREAFEAGERALASLKNAKASLGSARSWGIFDILGGKGLTGIIKHMKIGDARTSLDRAKADLNRFSRELSDVRELQGLDIEIGDFMTFADFFFDNIFFDLMVQSKIRQAQDKVDDAIWRVEMILNNLKRIGQTT